MDWRKVGRVRCRIMGAAKVVWIRGGDGGGCSQLLF